MSDEELVKRLRELRSNQYADPNTAPEFVFLDPDLPPSEWEKQYSMDVVYVRADRIEQLVAINEALTAKNEMLGREVNIARYGQPDFAWSIHKAAMADLEAKLAKAVDALRFYADENRYGLPSDGPWGLGSTDFGKIARALLAEIEGGKG
jgi:hypothetical protein